MNYILALNRNVRLRFALIAYLGGHSYVNINLK